QHERYDLPGGPAPRRFRVLAQSASFLLVRYVPAAARSPVVGSAFLADDGSYVCLAKPSGRFGQRVEDCLQIEGRAADHFEHIGGSKLVLKRFTQLVVETCVFAWAYGLGVAESCQF